MFKKISVLLLLAGSMTAFAGSFKGTAGINLTQMGVKMSAVLPLVGEINMENSRVASLTMTSSVAQLQTANSEARDAGVGSLWLDGKKYPTASFRSQKVTPTSNAGVYNVTGVLTIKNSSKVVTFPATINNHSANAVLDINRLDYELGLDMWKDVNVVSNKVQLIMKGHYE